jgi:phosphopantothenoylcysteine synthetase/decarboxylase
MININSIIHIENQAFDTEKDIAFLCVKDYQFNNNSVGYKFEKDNIYSVAFAKKQRRGCKWIHIKMHHTKTQFSSY